MKCCRCKYENDAIHGRMRKQAETPEDGRLCSMKQCAKFPIKRSRVGYPALLPIKNTATTAMATGN